MVKTPFGRKPGPKLAKITKKLRQRRRMAERELREAAHTEIVDTFSCEVTTARTSPPPSSVKEQCRPMNAIKAPSPGVSTAELPEPCGKDQGRLYYAHSATSVVSSTSSSSLHDGEKADEPVFECDRRVPGLTICVRCREPSEAPNGNSNGPAGKRQSVSESSVHNRQATSLTAPPRLAATFVAEADRPQHADEETDRYLAHHFTPSLLNVTTADEPTQDTRSDDFIKLRNLFSSDTHVTAPSKGTSAELSTIDTDSHYLPLEKETAPALSGEQAAIKPGLPATLSDASLGLNTLFDNKTTEGANTSCETTTMGLRSLFEEEGGRNPSVKSATSTFGLNTLFNSDHGKDDTTSLSNTTSWIPTGLTSTTCTSSRPHSSAPKSCRYCHCESGADMPAVTASSSLLGNLFGSSAAVHEDDDLLTEKERKKVMIAKDLAAYLNSDDERTHPKSTSLSTFVQQIEVLFGNYRAAIRMIEDLKAEKDQHQ